MIQKEHLQRSVLGKVFVMGYVVAKKYWPMLLVAFIIVVEISAICMLNGGLFLYTLDDPYLHLALAEHIARGHYGINIGEPAAPSSSALWPFLLAPLVGVLGSFAPLFVNMALAMVMVYAIGSFVATAELAEKGGVRWGALVLGIVLVSNLVGLVLTGMEHVLQVFCALLCALGLVRESRTGVLAPWFVAALLLGPLVRYENMAITMVCAGYLFVRSHRHTAMIVGVLPMIGLLGFSFFLHDQGLGWLPSSVLAKSALLSHDAGIARIAGRVVDKILLPQGLLLSTMVLGLLWSAWQRHRIAQERWMGFFAAVGGSVHIAFGEFGWYHRYEIYMMMFCFIIFLFLWRRLLQRLLAGMKWQRNAMAVLGIAVLMGCGYVWVLLSSPFAAHALYGQQYQMRRFAQEYLHAPVAVNDLGLVAYRNPNYVLDLWGLGSLEALHHRLKDASPEWMNALSRHYGVKVAMVYDSWFPRVPADWRVVAKLQLESPMIALGGATVTFYITDPSFAPDVLHLLFEFRRTLPKNSWMELPL